MARCLLLALGVLAVLGPVARAHIGPPYTIMVDRPAGPCLLSVWADPDVGTGTFFLIPEALPGQSLPDDLEFQLWTQPSDRRIPEVCYHATRQPMRNRVQYFVETEFATEEEWRVRIVVTSAAGTGEVETDVQVTPPGFGVWDLGLYLIPFVAIGVLWTAALLRRRPRR